MKLVYALFFFFYCAVISLHAEDNVVSCEKTYITPNQLHFTESFFFVMVNDLWIRPASLHVDANGFYFNSILYDERAPGIWACKRPGCFHFNPEWREICEKCGTPRGAS